MTIAALKLADIAARALFLLAALYLLPLDASGQFGLVVTLVGFFGFLCGFERYSDLQRRMAGRPDAVSAYMVLATVRFYLVNHALWLPVLAALLYGWIGLSPIQTALVLVLAPTEHFSSEVYRIALILPRHRRLLWIVFLKNLAALSLMAALVLKSGSVLVLDTILVMWAAVSGLGLVAMAIAFLGRARLEQRALHAEETCLARQYSASFTHFAIGIVALLSLQADRLVVGTLLPLEQSGLYFRHLFLAASVYQVTSVSSHNRILLRMYQGMQTGQTAMVRQLVRRELRFVLPVAVAVMACILAVDVRVLPSEIATLKPGLLSGLVLAYALRLVADYNSILLNAAHRERDVLRSQSLAVILSVALNVFLTSAFGLPGTVAAVACGSAAYLLAIAAYARRAVLAK